MVEKERKGPQYKDKEGNTLYGFSQVNLERTNTKLNSISYHLRILIVLVVVFLIGVAVFTGWVAYNDVITRLIYNG